MGLRTNSVNLLQQDQMCCGTHEWMQQNVGENKTVKSHTDATAFSRQI
jgi:hypothetical protein